MRGCAWCGLGATGRSLRGADGGSSPEEPFAAGRGLPAESLCSASQHVNNVSKWLDLCVFLPPTGGADSSTRLLFL